jgi:hypothetical protein
MDKYLIVRVFLILLAAVTLFVLISRYTQQKNVSHSEKFYENVQNLLPTVSSYGSVSNNQEVQPSESSKTDDFRGVEFNNQKLPADCFPKDRLTADDLLPKDAANSRWAQLNPAGQGDVKDQNFLQAGHHVGLNTTMGSMKNANMQFRSEVPNPKALVSPWMNSTYEPDVSRRPLEIGSEC